MYLAQEVFDMVARHLIYQNAKSCDDNDRSMYFGPWGRKCAIGCLIQSEYYDSKFENVGVCLIRFHQPESVEHALATALINSGVDVDNAYLLDILIDLQDCHDIIPTDRWYCELDAIARRHGLAITL